MQQWGRAPTRHADTHRRHLACNHTYEAFAQIVSKLAAHKLRILNNVRKITQFAQIAQSCAKLRNLRNLIPTRAQLRYHLYVNRAFIAHTSPKDAVDEGRIRNLEITRPTRLQLRHYPQRSQLRYYLYVNKALSHPHDGHLR